jgi:multidrug efflux system membrane fusion protein
MRRGHLSPVRVVVLLALAAAGCARHATPAPSGGSDVPPSKVNLKRNVELCKAEQRSLTYTVETVGVLEPEGQTEIAAGVTGIVDEVFFREGDDVSPADPKPLITVDQTKYLANLKMAEAAELRAKANLEMAQDMSNRAQQARQGVSDQERKQTSMTRQMMEAELLSSKASLDMARHNLKRSQVRAPYKGRINARKVTPGTYLEEKTVIATMADLSRLRLVGYVPETAAPTVRAMLAKRESQEKQVAAAVSPGTAAVLAETYGPGDPEFTVLAFPNKPFRARIFYMCSVADPSTHMFECKAEIDTRHLDVELRPGYTARIKFPLATNPDAVLIPEEAIRPTERGWVAFEPVSRPTKDGPPEWVAKARPVEPGYRGNGMVEIRGGLKAGQWIVKRGADALEDGTPLRVPDEQAKAIAP